MVSGNICRLLCIGLLFLTAGCILPDKVNTEREASMASQTDRKSGTSAGRGNSSSTSAGGQSAGNSSGGTQGGGQTAAAASKPATSMSLQERINNTFQERGAEYDRGLRGTPTGGAENTVTGRPYSDGVIPSISQPSPGQIVGALTSLVPGGILNSAGDALDAVSGGAAPRNYRGGFVGEALDSALGSTPGEEDGDTPNRIASSTNARGDAGNYAPTLAGTRAIVGDTDDSAIDAGSGGDYSDVALQDVPLNMRKKTGLAGTSLLTSGMV